ncbi:MAG: hypothetical protein AVDCRST_MAG56-5771 [uncultured Cytophagales bacterium]|uniref:Outer membrane protein beta-barrel domain-containing protein n=1 Tax=uncultured Cytophagales bacterium TaxID=158755 RepID=A0A6J4KG48_9SPHI|nr:MAG: hypothetical protein AVDCRST_MAG56-5771 [uncultured Cytophagales bacterium]
MSRSGIYTAYFFSMKHFYWLALPSLIFLLITPLASKGQNLEQLGVKKGIKTSGSVSLNTVGYTMHGTQARRDPFDWFVAGSLNLSLFGYAAPFSFSYSNTQRSYSQPFNQLSFAPQYKWVKTYVGYTSMNFSPYTLSGHVFLGGGVELTPGKWRLAAMCGRLQKPVSFNPADSAGDGHAAFRRMGYGLKAGYEDKGNLLEVSIFSAKDELHSIPYVLAQSGLTPKQNLALGLNGRKQIGRFFLQAEYALSSMVNDTRSEKRDSAAGGGSNLLKGLLPQTATDRYYDAINGSAGYQGSWYGLQVRYERIAPEYQTLGAYYFNNDLEHLTIAPSVRLIQNTLNLVGNVGIQHNNLDETRRATTKRWVGSLNAAYTPSEHWNLSVSHSNFSAYTNVRPQADPYFRDNLDTLDFYQVTHTSNATASYLFGKENHRQSLMLGGSYQKASDQAGYQGQSSLSDFYSANAAYSHTLSSLQATLATGVNYNSANSPGVSSTFWGPMVSLTRSFREKTLRSSVSSSYNQSSANGTAGSDVWNTRGSVNYAPRGNRQAGKRDAGKHNFSGGLNVLRRFKATAQGPGFTEWTATAGYTYSF